MTAKEYLSQYKDLNDSINAKLEQVGEQELHRPVQAPWPIGTDIGATTLGRTINIL